jgi:ribosome biogenesis GTPase / thiamine phosphate phosphatase
LLTQRFEQYQKLKGEKAASKPAPRKPSALASKPGWRKKSEGQQPYRHRQHGEE